MAIVSASVVIEKAKSYVGMTELPPNSNNVIFNTHYYGKAVSGSSYPWCAVFLWDVFRLVGASELFYGGKKCAYTPTLANYYKNNGQWYSTPEVGDLVFYQFSGSNRINHVGIVVEVISRTKIKTIEGNTGSGNDANGGAVMLRDRSTTYVKGYGRPRYLGGQVSNSDYTYLQFVKDCQRILNVPVTGVADGNTLNATIKVSRKANRKHPIVLPIQKYLNLLGYNVGKEDGDFGILSENGLKLYQRQWMKNPDGIIDAKGRTWKEMLKINI